MRKRSAVRAIILSPDDKILLARMQYPNTEPLWLTPGGGLEVDEDPVAALRRELNEEIFISDWDIGPLVWTREHRLTFNQRDICVNEIFYVVRSTKFDPPQAMPDENENQHFHGYRWWGVADINASDETFVPLKIGTYLPDLTNSIIPAKPIDVGV
ncbi:NUDIX domain-containing protein [Kiloniella majae]|uniref:NUDIX domain-containing protein n=1 Tax=Kiloniella majae TaxID=1938558 RepID=UPI000A2785AA|nr:NUDIX domain-containing protein [Kiloniella majae]